jgi:chitinase
MPLWISAFLVITCGTYPLRAAPWVTGYLPGWEQSQMAATNIDFSTITHLIHFSLVPQSNGSVNSSENGLSAINCASAVSAAHHGGAKAIVCVGGAGTESVFLQATTTAQLPGFVSNLVNFVNLYGYDGLDLDWEPFVSTDATQYTNLINAIRAAPGFSTNKLLTVAAPAYPSYGDSPTAEFTMLASAQSQLDQINVMTYDLSVPYEGWVTWFNSPIYDGGYKFPGTSELVPSIQGAVNNFISNGVAPAKLGLGVPFYGYIWTGGPGVTQPRQSWPNTNPPTVTTPTYNTIISSYYQSNRYVWDAVADAAYLSITNTPSSSDMFISYDDARACQCKVSYVRNRGLGGIMIWELAQDYVPGQPAPLVQAIKQSLATPSFVSIWQTGTNVSFNFTTLPLATYRLLWNSNYMGAGWNTITTNLDGTGGLLQVTDPQPATDPQRFYRIQTPP